MTHIEPLKIRNALFVPSVCPFLKNLHWLPELIFHETKLLHCICYTLRAPCTHKIFNLSKLNGSFKPSFVQIHAFKIIMVIVLSKQFSSLIQIQLSTIPPLQKCYPQTSTDIIYSSVFQKLYFIYETYINEKIAYRRVCWKTLDVKSTSKNPLTLE